MLATPHSPKSQRRPLATLGLALLAAALLTGCGAPEDAPEDDDLVQPPDGSPDEPVEAVPLDAESELAPGGELDFRGEGRASPETEQVELAVRVVDLAGNPLPNMQPIANRQRNAWDDPLSRGELTNSDGWGVLTLPPDGLVYVRAWDPTQRHHPNNFLSVHAIPGVELEPVTVTMVQAARLEARLVDESRAPVEDEPAELLLFHPDEGPWWPARTQTDPQGRVAFDHIPPGEYRVQIAGPSGRVELSNVAIRPGGSVDLGALPLTEP